MDLLQFLLGSRNILALSLIWRFRYIYILSGNFILYYIQNRISLLILLSYTLYILQPLDIAVFRPLKKHLTTALLYLNEAQLIYIQKAEWLSVYIAVRENALSTQNIASI